MLMVVNCQCGLRRGRYVVSFVCCHTTNITNGPVYSAEIHRRT